MGRTGLAAAAALAGLALAAPARAEPRVEADAEPIVLRFDAPAGCATDGAFFDEMRARTSRVRRAASGEPARVLRVSIAREGERVTGRLVVEDGRTASAPRVVVASTCPRVVRALAFVAALSVDPAATAPAIENEAGASGDGAATPPAETPAPSAENAASAAGEPPVDPPPAANAPRATPRAATAERTRPEAGGPPRAWRFGGGVALTAAGMAAPGARFGPRAFLDLLAEGPASGTLFAFAPALRLSAARLASAELSIPGASATFLWSTARIDGCPVGARLGATIALRPCVSFEAGTLHAEGVGVANLQSRLRPWLAVGAVARADWTIAAPLVVTGETGLVAPLVREGFFFAPDSLPGGTVYTAPPVAAEASLGLAVRFP